MQPIVTGRRLPLVVQLGFAGSRSLFDPKAHPHIVTEDFHAAVEEYLVQLLTQLPRRLEFGDEHFLCGISQLAVGGDTLFTRACQSLDIPQRIFLPQHRDEFLKAEGSDGEPDFTPGERAVALELFSSPHVIQDRVVSDASDRDTRFEDVNREIARVSDVLVCLVRSGAGARPGGTRDLINHGKHRNIPVLEICVAVKNGRPEFSEDFHGQCEFRPPDVPQVIAVARLPDSSAVPSHTPIAVCCQALLDLGDAQANWQRRLFKFAAGVIIGTHVLATILAVLVLAAHRSESNAPDSHEMTAIAVEEKSRLSEQDGETEPATHHIHQAVVSCLLAFEIVLLAAGLYVHWKLHDSQALHRWAMSRLAAEVARSVMAFGTVHVYLEHLFALPFPPDLRPLLRTINVLHLRSARSDKTAWEVKRKTYVEMRLTSPHGQIKYYGAAAAHAKQWLPRYQNTFLVCSGSAFLATLAKLDIVNVPDGFLSDMARRFVGLDSDTLTAILGGLAITLPVLAVAALSMAAALDLEARKHTYEEMLMFLEEHKERLKTAGTERDFQRLLLETESRLLGETANWYSRRAFTGVA